MIQVFKCDHCIHFTQDVEEMRNHEKGCSFNPTNKTCFTCKNKIVDGRTTNEWCDKDLSLMDGEENGNCVGWEAE